MLETGQSSPAGCQVKRYSNLYRQKRHLIPDKMFKLIKVFSARTIFLAAMVLITGAGCNKDEPARPPAANPVLSVKMVDAPSGYDAVYVEVIGLEANTGNGWTSWTPDNSGVYNLLTFINGNSLALMQDRVMTPCTISELRLILGTNNTVVIAGVAYELTTPSGQTSGYKVKMDPQTLIAGGVYHLVLDFNTEKSIHETGNGKYMLNPVVSGYLQTSVGSVAGRISPVNGAWYSEACNETDTAGTYINPVTGQFLIEVVLPGYYAVTFSPNSGYYEKTIPGVAVLAGQTTQVGTITIR